MSHGLWDMSRGGVGNDSCVCGEAVWSEVMLGQEDGTDISRQCLNHTSSARLQNERKQESGQSLQKPQLLPREVRRKRREHDFTASSGARFQETRTGQECQMLLKGQLKKGLGKYSLDFMSWGSLMISKTISTSGE